MTFMKDNGSTTKEKVKENFYGKMETFTMVNGFLTERMVMENILKQMETLIKVII